MPIVIDHGAPAITGLAAYTVGHGKGQERKANRMIPLLQQQMAYQHEFGRDVMRRGWALEDQKEAFGQRKELQRLGFEQQGAMQDRAFEQQGAMQQRGFANQEFMNEQNFNRQTQYQEDMEHRDIWDKINRGELELTPGLKDQWMAQENRLAGIEADNRHSPEDKEKARAQVKAAKKAILRAATPPTVRQPTPQEHFGQHYTKLPDGREFLRNPKTMEWSLIPSEKEKNDVSLDQDIAGAQKRLDKWESTDPEKRGPSPGSVVDQVKQMQADRKALKNMPAQEARENEMLDGLNRLQSQKNSMPPEQYEQLKQQWEEEARRSGMDSLVGRVQQENTAQRGGLSAGDTSNQSDFAVKWQTLKPGETMIGPDGKTYRKKG